jgi:hypothetical protein
MKRVVIDGVEYEELDSYTSDLSDGSYGFTTVRYRPLPPKHKTIVQVAAEAMEYDERRYRHIYDIDCAVYDAIEQRLQALEAKVGK